MATVGRANNASYLNTSRLSYISTAPFNNDFYTYSTAIINRVTAGVMVPVAGATSGNCPAARVLRETGRKLVPGANPMPAGFNTYMVSVYDAQTGLTGFIDPNAPIFAIYNTDKPNFLLDGVDPNTGLTDQGLSVYTRGSVTADAGVTTDTNVTAGGSVTAGTTVTVGTGLVIRNQGTNNSAGSATAGVVTLAAGIATVSTSAVTANSLIFVSTSDDAGTPGWLRVVSRAPGTSFLINSSSNTDTSKVSWLIIN